MFKIMRDLSKNHITEKDANEFAEYLEVVFHYKIKDLLDKRANKFFS